MLQIGTTAAGILQIIVTAIVAFLVSFMLPYLRDARLSRRQRAEQERAEQRENRDWERRCQRCEAFADMQHIYVARLNDKSDALRAYLAELTDKIDDDGVPLSVRAKGEALAYMMADMKAEVNNYRQQHALYAKGQAEIFEHPAQDGGEGEQSV